MNWWTRLKTFLHEVAVETKKVSWPSREEVVATTVVVIAASFVFGFVLINTVVLYRQALAGKGFRIADARPSIELAHEIRGADPIGLKGDSHPLAK